MFLQLYGVFVGHVYNHRREFGVQRLVVYSTATINLGVLLFACYNLKEVLHSHNTLVNNATELLDVHSAGLVHCTQICGVFTHFHWRNHPTSGIPQLAANSNILHYSILRTDDCSHPIGSQQRNVSPRSTIPA